MGQRDATGSLPVEPAPEVAGSREATRLTTRGATSLSHASAVRSAADERRREVLLVRLQRYEQLIAGLDAAVLILEPAEPLEADGDEVEEQDEFLQVAVVNQAGRAVFGLHHQTLLDRFDDALVVIDDEPAVDLIRQVLASREPRHLAETTVLVPSSPVRPAEVAMLPLEDGSVAILAVDLTAQHNAAEQLRAQVEHDGLTGLLNRAGFERRLARMVTRPEPLAVVLIELESFKEVNDALGHRVGDLLMTAQAERLVEAMGNRESIISRLGGAGFALAFRGGLAEAEHEANQLHQRITAPLTVEGVTTGIGCSIGLAARPFHAKTPDDLVRAAEIAMGAAKKSDQRVMVAGSGHAGDAVIRVQLGSRVDEAFERGWLQPYVQPIVDVQTGVVRGYEALARWVDPLYGVLTPGIFLDVIRAVGRMPDLTRAMVAGAVPLCGAGMFISINLDDQDLRSAALAADLWEQALTIGEKWGSRLWVEVSESDLAGVGNEHLNAYLADGFELAVDDFGTGVSSLARLQQLPVSMVKLEPVLLGDPSHRGATLLRSIVDLIHRLGAVVVAEGVETEEMAERARDAGCDLGQGFIYARPTPMARVLPLLDAVGPITIADWPSDQPALL